MGFAEPARITIEESPEAFLIVRLFAGLGAKLGHAHARVSVGPGAGSYSTTSSMTIPSIWNGLSLLASATASFSLCSCSA